MSTVTAQTKRVKVIERVIGFVSVAVVNLKSRLTATTDYTLPVITFKSFERIASITIAQSPFVMFPKMLFTVLRTSGRQRFLPTGNAKSGRLSGSPDLSTLLKVLNTVLFTIDGRLGRLRLTTRNAQSLDFQGVIAAHLAVITFLPTTFAHLKPIIRFFLVALTTVHNLTSCNQDYTTKSISRQGVETKGHVSNGMA